MDESLRFSEGTKAYFGQLKDMASLAVSRMLESPIEVADREQMADIVTERAHALANPDYRVLATNREYQRWVSGELTDVPRLFGTVEDVYQAVKAGEIYKGHSYYRSDQNIIDPSLTEEELHQKSTEYCSKHAEKFVNKAASLSERFADGTYPLEPLPMRGAIARLISGEGGSIFLDWRWSASSYRPTYEGLGVASSELSVSEEKVMAAVGLCIGLWVRLADDGTEVRPVSGHRFDPPFEHCSFRSLVRDSGWSKYTNVDELFRAGETETFTDITDNQKIFLDMFRDAQFFEDTHAILSQDS